MAKKKRSRGNKPRPASARPRPAKTDDEDVTESDDTSAGDEQAKASDDKQPAGDRQAKTSDDKQPASSGDRQAKTSDDKQPASSGDKQAKTSHDKTSGDKQAKTSHDKSNGKHTRRASKAPLPEAKVTKPAPPPEPAFWFGFEISWAKLVATRIILFSILALDAILQIRHAPRYGASDFNVAQLGFLDDLGPGRIAYGGGQLAIACLLMLAVFGVAIRVVVPIAAVIYAWLYFGSQLDSYQHHYLIALVLGIASFVPWCPRPDDAEPRTPVRSWALRLLLVQLGILYLWAAISKLDPAWLDGTTLGSQITGGMKSMIDGTIGFRAASILVIVVELLLAFTVWLRPGWLVAAPIGLLFHLGIVATGFEIGLFAYEMCALYALVIPDGVWVAIGDLLSPLGRKLRQLGERPGWAMVLAGVAVAVGLAALVRLPHSITIVMLASLFVLGLGIRRLVRGGAPVARFGYGLVAATLLWVGADRATTVAVDYYRFWGGSQRRIGDKAQAETAYRNLIAIAPDEEVGHFQLARLLLASDRTDEALEHLRTAQRVKPDRARSFTEEARVLARQGKQAEAIAKAKEAVFAEPSDSEARAVLDGLSGGAQKPPRQRPTPAGNDD